MSMALIPALNCTCLALRTLLASVTRALNELAPLGCATAPHRRSRHPVLTPPNSQPNQFPFAFCHPWGAEPTIPNSAVASCSPVTKGATFPRRLANAVPALPEIAKPCQFVLQAINCACAPISGLVPLTVLPLACVTPRLRSPAGPHVNRGSPSLIVK